jgi:hypothetical protein
MASMAGVVLPQAFAREEKGKVNGSNTSASDDNSYESQCHEGFKSFSMLKNIRGMPGLFDRENDLSNYYSGPKSLDFNSAVTVHTPTSEGEEDSQNSVRVAGSSPDLESSRMQGSESGSGSLSGENSYRNERRDSEDACATIKATYKNDITRFRVGLDVGYNDIREEISKRFKLKADGFSLKYLDDDEEWVILTCDADVSECIRILQLSGQNHIKLQVRD